MIRVVSEKYAKFKTVVAFDFIKYFPQICHLDYVARGIAGGQERCCILKDALVPRSQTPTLTAAYYSSTGSFTLSVKIS